MQRGNAISNICNTSNEILQFLTVVWAGRMLLIEAEAIGVDGDWQGWQGQGR